MYQSATPVIFAAGKRSLLPPPRRRAATARGRRLDSEPGTFAISSSNRITTGLSSSWTYQHVLIRAYSHTARSLWLYPRKYAVLSQYYWLLMAHGPQAISLIIPPPPIDWSINGYTPLQSLPLSSPARGLKRNKSICNLLYWTTSSIAGLYFAQCVHSTTR